MPRFGILALAALASAGAAVRTPNAGGLQDLAAYPKYEVVFLNDQPLSASDAARCRSEGLVNDDDFLVIHPRSRATIEAEAAARGEAESESDNDNDDDDDNDNNDNGNENAEDGGDSSDAMPSNIELMTLHYTHQGETGAHAYLCALPSANRTAEQATSAAQPHDEPQPDAAASWLALSHLDGQCLYVRHRWFTYA
jgi:protein OS-9